jgi:hypothetical protein
VVLRTFSPARAWHPAVVARLARTLGLTFAPPRGPERFECAVQHQSCGHEFSLSGQTLGRSRKARQQYRAKLLVTAGKRAAARRSRNSSPNPAGFGPARQPLKRGHIRQGAERPAKQPVGCGGSRVRLPQQASPRFGQVNSRSLDFGPPAARSGRRSSSPWHFTNRGFTPGEA